MTLAEALGRRVQQARQPVKGKRTPLVLAEALGCRVHPGMVPIQPA